MWQERLGSYSMPGDLALTPSTVLALEVDQAVHLLDAPADAARGDLAAVVAPAGFGERARAEDFSGSPS
jgi:hypothetical protein